MRSCREFCGNFTDEHESTEKKSEDDVKLEEETEFSMKPKDHNKIKKKICCTTYNTNELKASHRTRTQVQFLPKRMLP